MIKFTDLEKQKPKIASEEDKTREEAEARLVKLHKEALNKKAKESEDAR